MRILLLAGFATTFLATGCAGQVEVELDRAAEQGALTTGKVLPMRQGAHGPNVTLLQHALTDHGFDTPITGIFDAATFQQVRWAQKKAGLPMEGVVDEATAAFIEFVPIEEPDPPPAPAAPTWTPPPPIEPLSWDAYADLIRGAGGNVPTPGGQPTVLGLRTQTTSSHDYLDTFVVLTGDGRVVAFHGSTVPSYKGKGRGELVPGNYNVVPHGLFHLDDAWQEAKPSFEIRARSGGLPTCWRDGNGDGIYDDDDRARTSPMSGELFHAGWSDDYTQHPHHPAPASEGCMNLPYDEMDDFVTAVGGARASFRFTLVDAP